MSENDDLLALLSETGPIASVYLETTSATTSPRERIDLATLLIHDDPADDRTLWFGPDGVDLAMSPGLLTERGVTSPQEGRLPDVLIRAALATGSEVRIVPTTAANGPTDNVGAILRWAD